VTIPRSYYQCRPAVDSSRICYSTFIKQKPDNFRFAVLRLTTENARSLAATILDTDSSNWWFKDKSDWWVNGGNPRLK